MGRDAVIAALSALALHAVAQPAPDIGALTQQVLASERAFARSMAERNFQAFQTHLSDQAVFFDGKALLRGKAAVAAGWKPLFDASQAPFSWEPDQVEVLGDGTLALSTGPVKAASGKVVARYNTVWRQESPGVWRVVFDKGQPADP